MHGGALLALLALAAALGLALGITRLARIIEEWRLFRRWVEYRSRGDELLFPPTRVFPHYDANLEMRINRLARSHTDPARTPDYGAREQVAEHHRAAPGRTAEGDAAMKLAEVLTSGGQWIIGIVERDLPVTDEDAPGILVLRNPASVIYTPLAVQSELGGQGLGAAKVLEPAPLEDALLEIGEDHIAGLGYLTVDPGQPPNDFVKRYLGLFATPIVAGDGRPLGRVTEAERSGAAETPGPRRVRLTS